jgi:hypothetical protein
MVGGLSELANENLTRSDEARDAGVWTTTDTQDADIGDPLGSIAARHLSLGKLAESPDAEDLVKVIAATAAYLTAQIKLLLQIRRNRRLRKAPPASPDLTQHPPTEDPT